MTRLPSQSRSLLRAAVATVTTKCRHWIIRGLWISHHWERLLTKCFGAIAECTQAKSSSLPAGTKKLRCPYCGGRKWFIGTARLGIVNRGAGTDCEVTKCARCGFFHMSDVQIDAAEAKLNESEKQ